jgi:hypothetical protein
MYILLRKWKKNTSFGNENYNCGYENFEFLEISFLWRKVILNWTFSNCILYHLHHTPWWKNSFFFVKYDTKRIFKPKSILFVCLRPVSCVLNVTSVFWLFVFVLCLVCSMLPVSLDCLSSSCVLWQKESLSPNQYSYINVIENRKGKQEWTIQTLVTLGTQDTGRRQTIQRQELELWCWVQ